ncbi:hypothetical protein SCQ32_04260 [Streptococcus canis]|nr:hypothetical protein [Streptococcus canis]
MRFPSTITTWPFFGLVNQEGESTDQACVVRTLYGQYLSGSVDIS